MTSSNHRCSTLFDIYCNIHVAITEMSCSNAESPKNVEILHLNKYEMKTHGKKVKKKKSPSGGFITS